MGGWGAGRVRFPHLPHPNLLQAEQAQKKADEEREEAERGQYVKDKVYVICKGLFIETTDHIYLISYKRTNVHDTP